MRLFWEDLMKQLIRSGGKIEGVNNAPFEAGRSSLASCILQKS